MLYLAPQAQYVINALEKRGFEGYAVGGCVRDMLVGREPADWDVATNALPKQVKEIFERTADTGLKHGTVTVISPYGPVEVTTYRSEGQYKDNRRPSEVTFEKDINKDLSRRDFTINAMAYNPKTGVIDPFGGRADVERMVIRCVGDPKERFREDALRLLRAVRFACVTGFEIEEKTAAAITADAPLLRNISAERIRDELCKALVSDFPSRLLLLRALDLDTYFLPELKECFFTLQNHPYHLYNVGEHIIKVVENTPRDLELRLSALLHDIGKPQSKSTDQKGIDHFYGHGEKGAEMTAAIMRRLRFDNTTLKKVTTLVRAHDAAIDGSPLSVRRVAARVGKELFPKLVALERADAMGQNPEMVKGKLEALRCAEEYFEANRDGMVLSVGQLAVSGQDLIALGFKEGPEIGRVLDILLKKVIKDPDINKREQLTNLAKGMIG